MKVIFIIIFLFISCASTRYINPEESEPTREWGPTEISATVDTMVVSVQNYFETTKEKPYIELNKIQNKTSEHIDTGMLANEISTNLIKRKIVFVDRSHRGDALKEMELGQRGIVSANSALPTGEFLSPNFKLNGEITDNVRYVNEEKVQYIVVTLRLLKLSTGGVVWQDEKKFLKVSTNQKFGW
ncbi:MAG TPA: penicillin-binding protein activator LpoB [Leptospiraceae bacterium]|nr:penicillin-binding protein activator LpoB [Leptospiraceae bacterium]HMW03999.1 penicillin-binding protein activator LpoB [Leptospiraceae bacterium]HMX30889.1 penicillin-binding protein activator LpoB [Leptospiraceae bacterium]HMY29993.1 penicillin-binding protein activator LpoB [Leptospiraceae bacterium]HMZ65369.1 penicillin-binding protein activator LpoB [Leptospiraceae bacterium]